MGRFDMTQIMTDAWRIFNNMFVSLAPVTAAVVGIAVFALALSAIFQIVRRAAG